MRMLFSMFVALGLSGTCATPAPAQGKLAGIEAWTVVKSEEAPPGTKMTFADDGKLTIAFKIDGKERIITGTYALAGNQLTLKLNQEGRERVETRTVKKLTATMLITEDKNRKTEELQRNAK